MNDVKARGAWDGIGLALFGLGAFLLVLDVMALWKGVPEQGAGGTMLLAKAVTDALGLAPSLLLAAGLTLIGARLFLFGGLREPFRHLGGLASVSMGLAVLCGAIVAGAGGAVGAVTGGALASALHPVVGFVIGLVAVAAPVWLFWLSRELPLLGDAAARSLAGQDAGGVSAAEAAALAPSRGAAARAHGADADADEEEGDDDDLGPVAPLAGAGTDEATLPPSPYPPDVRRRGEIPAGARPLDAPDDRSPEEGAPGARAVRRWTPKPPSERDAEADAPGEDLAAETAEELATDDGAPRRRKLKVGGPGLGDPGLGNPAELDAAEGVAPTDLDPAAPDSTPASAHAAGVGLPPRPRPLAARPLPPDVRPITRDGRPLGEGEEEAAAHVPPRPSWEAADDELATEVVAPAAQPAETDEASRSEAVRERELSPEEELVHDPVDAYGTPVTLRASLAAAETDAPAETLAAEEGSPVEVAEADLEEPVAGPAEVDAYAAEDEDDVEEADTEEVADDDAEDDGAEDDGEVDDAYAEDEATAEDDAEADVEDEDEADAEDDADDDAYAEDDEDWEYEDDEEEYDDDEEGEYEDEEYEEEGEETEGDELEEAAELEEAPAEGGELAEDDASAEAPDGPDPVSEAPTAPTAHPSIPEAGAGAERAAAELARAGGAEPEVVLEPAPAPADRVPTPARTGAEKADADEELLLEAGTLILDEGRVAVSLLQRRFGLDFDRACALLDSLQELGLIGPYLGGNRRDILLTRDEWMEKVTSS